MCPFKTVAVTFSLKEWWGLRSGEAWYSRGGVLCAESTHVHRMVVVGDALVEAHVHRCGRVDLHLGLELALPDLPLMHLWETDT